MSIQLEPASRNSPSGLREFLADLADGESGFSGTPVHTGEATLEEYLKTLCDLSDASKVAPDRIPQTSFWVIGPSDRVVGMVRVRHHLVPHTRINGGHIGFYIHSSYRGRGFAKRTLALALVEVQKFGEPAALVTVYSTNQASIATVESLGVGVSEVVFDARSQQELRHYWFEFDNYESPIGLNRS